MSHTTQGTLLLTRLGIAFELHPYPYDPDAPRIGLHAAESLGIDPGQTFKTLMAEVDGKPVCVVIPSDTEASMKKPHLHQCRPARPAAQPCPRRCGEGGRDDRRRSHGLS